LQGSCSGDNRGLRNNESHTRSAAADSGRHQTAGLKSYRSHRLHAKRIPNRTVSGSTYEAALNTPHLKGETKNDGHAHVRGSQNTCEDAVDLLDDLGGKYDDIKPVKKNYNWLESEQQVLEHLIKPNRIQRKSFRPIPENQAIEGPQRAGKDSRRRKGTSEGL